MTDSILVTRLQKTSDSVWMNATGTVFIPAFAFNVAQDPTSTCLAGDQTKCFHFPIIRDQDPPTPARSANEENLGDIQNQTNFTDFDNAVSDCQNAWKDLTAQLGIPNVGIIAVNIGKYVQADGTPEPFLGGLGGKTIPALNAATLPTGETTCANPLTGFANPLKLTYASGGAVVVADRDDTGRLLAHELGHVLNLWHGDRKTFTAPSGAQLLLSERSNGLDDNTAGANNNNNVFDEICDPKELDQHTFSQDSSICQTCSLMTNGYDSILLTPLQKARAFEFSLAYINRFQTPSNIIANGNTLGDSAVDHIHDVADPSIDMTSVAVIVNPVEQTTILTHELLGSIPIGVANQYLVFTDLDGNPGTGGAPSTLGFVTSFQGAELVTRVVVTTGPDPEFQVPVVTPTVWRFQNGAFLDVTNSNVSAALITRLLEDTPQTTNAVVIRIPDDLRGPLGTHARIQAVAQELGRSGELDRVPDNVDGGVTVSPGVPQFPACVVSPAQVHPGAATSIVASGLLPNQPADVLLADRLVAGGTTSGTGTFNINFVIPFDAALGPRPMFVRIRNTALAGTCGIEVVGPPATVTPVYVDVKPQSCPNPLNVNVKGTVPVAVLGTASFNASNIDPASIRLEGVAPLGSAIKDVATPFAPVNGLATDCTTAGRDGFADLALNFDAKALAAALGTVADRDVRILRLTGNLRPSVGGAPIQGGDVVVILKR